MNLKRILKPYLLLSAACIPVLSGCGGSGNSSQDSARPRLAVSVEPQKYILDKIAGDRFEVVTLLENGANPETYDPPVSRRVAVDRSKAFFTTGLLPFEKKIIESFGNNVPVFDTCEGIELVYGTHSHGDDHHSHSKEEADPHVWTSVANAAIIARNMEKSLEIISPADSLAFRANLEQFLTRLDSIDNVVRSRMPKAGTAFAVWHPSLSYFARDYGLKQISVGSESKEMSARKLSETVETARADSVKVFFFQKEYDSRQAETLNNMIGSRLVTINPLSYDWEGQIDIICGELEK